MTMPPKRKTDDSDTKSSDLKKERLDADNTKGPDGECSSAVTSSCNLDEATQDLIEFIFDEEMFLQSLRELSVDVAKMPLDKINLALIDKGLDVLEKLEEETKKKDKKDPEKIEDLHSEFYAMFPHKQQTPIHSSYDIQEKYDLLNTLPDMKFVLDTLKERKGAEQHPLDANYNWLNYDFKLLESNSEEFKMIVKYASRRRGNVWRGCKVRNAWTIKAKGEEKELNERDGFPTRKLLWYGASAASTAAILKNGLHIKPHGVVDAGHGVLFADTLTKSGFHSPPVHDMGILFLCEVALGRAYKTRTSLMPTAKSLSSHEIEYDSMEGCGSRGPDPKGNITIQMDGKDVIVPLGKEKEFSRFNVTYHSTSYVSLKEEQYKLRYIILFDF